MKLEKAYNTIIEAKFMEGGDYIMDKGIFYLVCSIVIIMVVASTTLVLDHKIASVCVGKTITQVVSPTISVTPSLTATPTAGLKSVLFKKAVTATPTK